MAEYRVPLCKKCGERHYNMDACPKPVKMGEGVGRFVSPDGFHTMKGWGGRNTRGVPVVYQMPVRPRLGSLTGADGQPYDPAA